MFQDQIVRFGSMQYPERAERYAQAVQELAAPLSPLLLDETKRQLDALNSAEHPIEIAQDVTPLSVSSDSSAASNSSVASVDTHVLLLQTQAALEHAGFMFLQTTSLHPRGNSVDVTDIALGTQRGDISMHFTFDPATSTVTNIEQDGTTMPYSMPLEQFVEWGRAR